MQTVQDLFKEDLNVKMDSPECKLFKETHENCFGCEYEKDCKEYVMRFGQYVTATLQAEGAIPQNFEWTDEPSFEAKQKMEK